MGVTTYFLPANYGSIEFRSLTGGLYSGTLTVNATRTYYAIANYGSRGFNILNGYIASSDIVVRTGEYPNANYLYDIEFDDGAEQISFSENQYGHIGPDFGTAIYIIGAGAAYPIEATINISPESPQVLDLYADGNLAASGTSLISFVGDASVLNIKLGNKMLLNKVVDAAGPLNLNFALKANRRQVDISSLSIEDDGQVRITNNTGDEISRLEVFSV